MTNEQTHTEKTEPYRPAGEYEPPVVPTPLVNTEEGQMPDETVSLASRLMGRFLDWKEARRQIEEEWMKDLRQFLGIYEADIEAKLQAQGSRSRVYISLTRTKVMAAYSKIVDLLFQPGEQPYSIQPTPVPEIPGLAEQLTERAISDVGRVNPEALADPNIVAERMAEVMQEMVVEARHRAERMQKHIEDQTVELNLERKLKDTIMEMCVFGSGALKVGTVVMEKTAHWENGKLVYRETPRPELEAVSIFDLYPDPFATSMEDAEGLFRRYILTKSAFRKLKDAPGFNKEAVTQILMEYQNGNHNEEQFERDRRLLSNANPTTSLTNRFEVLEYWGTLDGQQLRDHGLTIKDEELCDEFEACVWICANRVIRCQLNPTPRKKIPYLIAPYEKIPHQFWGYAPPRMMRDSQSMLNAAVRVMLDNLGISSGPQVEVNTDLLKSGEDPTQIYPWRVWLREGGDAQQPMMRFYQPQNNAAVLQSVIEVFRRFADETTSLPSYTHGMQTNTLNATATGMSMLMGAANINLKSVIKNLDDFIIKPMVTGLYDWNMEFSDDETIKGDLRIHARGSTALIQKEVQSQRLLQFISLVMNPVFGNMVDLPGILQDAAKAMEINPERIHKAAPVQQEQPGQPGVDSMVPAEPPQPDPSQPAMGHGSNGMMSNA